MLKRRKVIRGNWTERNFGLIVSSILILLVLSLAVNAVIFLKQRSLAVSTVGVSFEVSDKLGIDLDSSALNFGRLIRGSSISRNVRIINNYDFPVVASIYVSKSVRDYIISGENISLSPGESLSVPFRAVISEDMPYGNYSGEIVIKFNRNEID